MRIGGVAALAIALALALAACAAAPEVADNSAVVGDRTGRVAAGSSPLVSATDAPLLRGIGSSPSGRYVSAWSRHKPCRDCTTEAYRYLFVWRDDILWLGVDSWAPVAWSPTEDVLFVVSAAADDDVFWNLLDFRDGRYVDDMYAGRLDLRGHRFEGWSADGAMITLRNVYDDSVREIDVAEWLGQ